MIGKHVNKKHAKMQKDLIMRLSRGSPERETTINYIINTNDGTGTIQKKSISSFQGAREPYYSSQSRIKDSRNKDNSVLMTTSKLFDNRRSSVNSPANNFMKKRRTAQSLLANLKSYNKSKSRQESVHDQNQIDPLNSK